MTKRKLLIFIFSTLILVSLVGQISAGFSSLSMVNEFENGIVDIQINDGETSSHVVVPYSEICKNPSITNNGSDCYVRVKVLFSNEGIADDVTFVGIKPDWALNDDGYLYYTNILHHNETVEIFDSVKLGNIGNEHQTTEFSVDIAVDAIQSKNFTVDFASASPWGDVAILKVEGKDSNITEYQPLPDTSFKIIYHDDVKGMVKNFDGFFSSISTLMPGDAYEDVLEIQNNTNRHKTIYFTTSNAMNEEFLNNVVFKIIDEDNNAIYEGNLGENKEIVIEALDANTSSKVKFRIEVPTEIGNEFALDTSSVEWTFSTKQVEDVPQTGDNSHVELYFVLMVASIVGLLFTIRGMKKHDEKVS